MPKLQHCLRSLLVASVATAFVAVGCKDQKPEIAASPLTNATASAPIAAATSAAPSISPATPNGGDPNDLAGLFAKLESEKTNRPAGANPTVEKVFDTISGKSGIALDDKKQIAGFPVGARYCSKAVTKTDIHVVTCEYMDAAAAKKGVETASVTNKYLKRREVVQLRATTLSIHQTAETDAAAADAKKIKEAFLAL